MSYPLRLREHVMEVKKEEELTYQQAASRFKIGVASIIRWAKRIEPQKTRNRVAIKLNREKLMEDVEKYPSAYQRERAKRLRVSRPAIYKGLKRLGVTYKKNPYSIRRLTLLPEKLLRQR
jgi:transposase